MLQKPRITGIAAFTLISYGMNIPERKVMIILIIYFFKKVFIYIIFQ